MKVCEVFDFIVESEILHMFVGKIRKRKARAVIAMLKPNHVRPEFFGPI